jgi:hypothetical protein
MLENFFSHVNIDPRNVHIPDGTITGDYEKYCASYEEETSAPAASIFRFSASAVTATSDLMSPPPASPPKRV